MSGLTAETLERDALDAVAAGRKFVEGLDAVHALAVLRSAVELWQLTMPRARALEVVLQGMTVHDGGKQRPLNLCERDAVRRALQPEAPQ